MTITAAKTAASQIFRSPKELIELYWEEVWNNGNVALIREICADPIIRHDVGSVTLLSHDEQIARVSQQAATLRPHFTHEVLNFDDTHVTSVWNMTSATDATMELCGIETFRAENGRFTDCWNTPYSKGRWGRVGDASVAETLPPPERLATIDAIDHAWLQKVFKAAGVDVPRIAMVHKIERVGNGTTSDVARLHFGYNADAADAPATLIAKFQSRNQDVLPLAAKLGVYEREVAAYRFFGTDKPFHIPRCYFAAGSGNDFNLILEDLTGKGESGNQLAGCGPAQAAAVIREFAALHAYYWHDSAAKTLDWPVRFAALAPQLSEFFFEGARIFRARYKDALGEAWLDLIDEAAPLVGKWAMHPPAYVTVIHGEPRVDNIFFKAEPGGVRACLIDLQQITLGDPIFDLAYFLTGSLSPEDRRACEKDLVRMHGEELHAIDPEYDVAAAWGRYKAHAIAGLISTVAAAAIIAPTAHNHELLVALAKRNCAATEELDGIACLKRMLAA